MGHPGQKKQQAKSFTESPVSEKTPSPLPHSPGFAVRQTSRQALFVSIQKKSVARSKRSPLALISVNPSKLSEKFEASA
jgi:hypothetical protein